jgi:hypothetical protein
MLNIRELLSVVVAHDTAGRVFLDGPRRREVAFAHVTKQVRQLFAFVGQQTIGSIVADVEGYQRIGYPQCKLVEEKKKDPIGGSPWNILGGNSENFIRPQTRRPGYTLYSPRSVDGRARCAETSCRREEIAAVNDVIGCRPGVERGRLRQ